MNEIICCEVCGQSTLSPSLKLGNHPMCDDLVPLDSNVICKEYPIEILFCTTCWTAHQKFQIPKLDLFPATYHYRSRHTADVINGMHSLVAACEQKVDGIQGKKVLDIGCNDGSLLSIFREKGAETFGIEPTGAAADATALGHSVVNGFFDEDLANQFVVEFGQPDIITFTNVFAHIEDLHAVMRSLKILSHSSTKIIIENHYLGSILNNRQFDTFYHEHPRTYSYRSFCFIAEALGMYIGKVEFPSRYGGNIRVYLMPRIEKSSHDLWAEMEAKEQDFGGKLSRLSVEIGRWRSVKTRQLADAANKHGPLKAKAFPGRSAIPIKLLNLDGGIIEAVFEKPASGKIGHYVPGTRIPIKSDDDFEKPIDNAPLVNMAWHIAEEIRVYMRSRGFEGPMIDIIAASDFEK